MTVPKVKVMRLEIMLTAMNDCDVWVVIDEAVGATALTWVTKVWNRATVPRCDSFDLEMNLVNRKSGIGDAIRGRKGGVGVRRQVEVEGRI